MTKIEAANEMLQHFASETTIERRKGGWYVCWDGYDGRKEKRWITRGQDFYPMWHREWPHGGTASTALSQLIRWLRGQPVLSLQTWRYWAGDRVRLIDSLESVDILKNAGYPEKDICVLCDKEIEKGLDWWSLDGVSGPCCDMTSGCRQEWRKKWA